MTIEAAPSLKPLVAWCQAHNIALCVLFGSRARDQARPGSDYDLALKSGHPPALLDRVAWQTELESLLDADVSLVLLTPTTDPVLGWEIARNGKLVYERERGLYVSERVCGISTTMRSHFVARLPNRYAPTLKRCVVVRDVLLRKLAYLRRLLRNLEPFAQMSRDEIEAQHYTVERILELLVGAAADRTFHILAECGLTPTSYCKSLRLAAQEGLLPGRSGGTVTAGGGDAEYSGTSVRDNRLCHPSH